MLRDDESEKNIVLSFWLKWLDTNGALFFLMREKRRDELRKDGVDKYTLMSE